jgi:hypothetical protein
MAWRRPLIVSRPPLIYLPNSFRQKSRLFVRSPGLQNGSSKASLKFDGFNSRKSQLSNEESR